MRYVNRVATFCALAFAALAFTPQPGQAGPLPINGLWHEFDWNNGPGVWVNDSPFIFTSAGVIIVDITDAYSPGDLFEVYNHGVLIGTTSIPNVPAPYIADPDLAFAHPGFSSGSFILGPGSHSIGIKVIQVPNNTPNGAGYIRVQPYIDLSEVPEPTSMTMAGLGLAGLAYAGYRRWRRRPVTEVSEAAN